MEFNRIKTEFEAKRRARSSVGKAPDTPATAERIRGAAVCAKVPLPRPLPVRSSRRGEKSIPLRQGASHLPPPRSLRGRTGEGGGLPSRSHPKLAAGCPTPTSPGSFGGGGPVVPARRGPAPDGPKHQVPLLCNQPPPVFCGGGGRGLRAGGGALSDAVRSPSQSPNPSATQNDEPGARQLACARSVVPYSRTPYSRTFVPSYPVPSYPQPRLYFPLRSCCVFVAISRISSC